MGKTEVQFFTIQIEYLRFITNLIYGFSFMFLLLSANLFFMQGSCIGLLACFYP